MSGGRLVIHYCPFGDPGNGADQRFMLWTREAYDAVVPTLAQKAFDVIHLESAPIHLPSFANVTIPIVPSWHGVM